MDGRDGILIGIGFLVGLIIALVVYLDSTVRLRELAGTVAEMKQWSDTGARAHAADVTRLKLAWMTARADYFQHLALCFHSPTSKCETCLQLGQERERSFAKYDNALNVEVAARRQDGRARYQAKQDAEDAERHTCGGNR